MVRGLLDKNHRHEFSFAVGALSEVYSLLGKHRRHCLLVSEVNLSDRTVLWKLQSALFAPGTVQNGLRKCEFTQAAHCVNWGEPVLGSWCVERSRNRRRDNIIYTSPDKLQCRNQCWQHNYSQQ